MKLITLFWPSIMVVMMAYWISSCTGSGGLTERAVIHPDDIVRLEDSRSYVYLGNYQFFAMRPGHGSNILLLNIDSVTLMYKTGDIYIRGQVMVNDGYSEKPIQGAKALVAKISTHEGTLIEGTERPTETVEYFRINDPQETMTDSDGRFTLRARADSASSLVIVHEGDAMIVYHIGKLLSSTTEGKRSQILRD
jgi:hypothetical protein